MTRSIELCMCAVMILVAQACEQAQAEPISLISDIKCVKGVYSRGNMWTENLVIEDTETFSWTLNGCTGNAAMHGRLVADTNGVRLAGEPPHAGSWKDDVFVRYALGESTYLVERSRITLFIEAARSGRVGSFFLLIEKP